MEAARLYPGPLGRLLAFCIAGHHGGLADGAGATGSLDARLRGEVPDYRGWEALVPRLPADAMPRLRDGASDLAYTLAFLGRMIFSCLVDADFLETGRFYEEAEGRVAERGGHAPLARLRDRLDRFLARFDGRDGPVDAHRATILRHARAKAALPPGLFTMTVPTGGGKTLAGLAFALDHAIRHGLHRVVYVIPYTSIIEQTAAIFREALADDAGDAPDVLEHHGNVDWDAVETDADGRDALAKLRRAAENWDVPVVVTTAVQFFESLHANRTSRCRKLHNLANSVVVLDEAQTLPLPLLRPCMAALDELVRNYGASVVLCTATQPALRRQDGFENGFDIGSERELAPDPAGLYQALQRVTVAHVGPATDAAIADRFAARDRMLCIVNSRKHAQTLYRLIEDQPGARHLTTLMCPAHRRRVLAEVRADLAGARAVRLVSTSLIEAGVDVDFPEVWRAENGLDSVAQAAGRCNREGKLERGSVTVFTAADAARPAMFNQQVEAMEAAVRAHPDDPLGLDAVRTYFRQLYWQKGAAQLDAATLDGGPFPILHRIWAGLGADGTLNTPYASVARAFRMIPEEGKPVIVTWRGGDNPDEVERLVATLCAAPVPPARTLRRLQQFTVTIPERAYRAMLAAGAIQPVASERYADRFMLVQDVGLYRDATGLSLDPYDVATDAMFM
jgi:CRISPR-associated endonuclease/helicase Cas3